MQCNDSLWRRTQLRAEAVLTHPRVVTAARLSRGLAPERSGFLRASDLDVLVEDEQQRERLVGRHGPDGIVAFVQRRGEHERRELLEYYLARTGVTVPDLDVNALVDAMAPELTHDWVRDIAEHAVVCRTQAELLRYVGMANEKRALAAGEDDELPSPHRRRKGRGSRQDLAWLDETTSNLA